MTGPPKAGQQELSFEDRSLAHQLPAIQAVAFNGEGWVVQVELEPGLQLAGLKARLVLERIRKQQEVFYAFPADDALDDLNTITCLTVGLRDLPESGEVHLNVQGVIGVEVRSLSEVAAQAAREAAEREQAAAQAKSEAGASSEAKKKPGETLRVDIERLDQLMNLAGELVISKARFSQIEEGLKSTSVTRLCTNSMADVFATLDRISKDLEGVEGRRDRPG